MSDNKLKPNWKMVKFGDVVHQIKDRVTDIENCGITEYTRGEHFQSENLHLIGRSKLGDGQHGSAFHMRFKPGDVLYVSRNPQLRKVAVADYEGICANTSYVFRADEQFLLQELLPFIMQTEDFVEYTIQHKRGSTNFYLNPSDIEPYEFPLPPLDEQRRIADLLWAADDVITQHQDTANKLKQLWVAAASHYFSRTNGNKEFKLGDLLEYGSDGPFGSKLKTEHYVDDGVRVIRLQNIQENYFDDTDRAYISAEYYQNELIRYTVNSGDVLVAGLGDESIRAGRACIAPSYLGEAINKADCYCLRPKSNLNSNYLVAFFNSPYGLRQSESFAQGTTRFRLNLGNIKRMKISLPDLKTQVTVAEKLYEIQNCTELEEQHIEKSIELKKQLLNRMLLI
jgi:type I restriction enzyme, S subunit